MGWDRRGVSQDVLLGAHRRSECARTSLECHSLLLPWPVSLGPKWTFQLPPLAHWREPSRSPSAATAVAFRHQFMNEKSCPRISSCSS